MLQPKVQPYVPLVRAYTKKLIKRNLNTEKECLFKFCPGHYLAGAIFLEPKINTV